MDIELEKLKKLEHALCDAIDILRDWQVEEAKPEEEKWIVYLNRPIIGDCYLASCYKSNWKSAQRHYGAKTQLFVGIFDEVEKWCQSHQKFSKVIKAWEDGEKIQFKASTGLWNPASNPNWDLDIEYRVNKKCGECLHKYCSATKEPCVSCVPGNRKFEAGTSKFEAKKYRPYESSAEMIVDFIDRFKVKCPSYCEPLIWVKGKGTDNRDELLKENAGLKARLNAINLLTPELEKASKEERQQLAKAKELLTGFVSKMKNSVYTPYEKDLIERAEQFLNEVEK